MQREFWAENFVHTRGGWQEEEEEEENGKLLMGFPSPSAYAL